MVKFVDDELRAIRTEVLDMWTLVYEQMKTYARHYRPLTRTRLGKCWYARRRSTQAN